MLSPFRRFMGPIATVVRIAVPRSSISTTQTDSADLRELGDRLSALGLTGIVEPGEWIGLPDYLIASVWAGDNDMIWHFNRETGEIADDTALDDVVSQLSASLGADIIAGTEITIDDRPIASEPLWFHAIDRHVVSVLPHSFRVAELSAAIARPIVLAPVGEVDLVCIAPQPTGAASSSTTDELEPLEHFTFHQLEALGAIRKKGVGYLFFTDNYFSGLALTSRGALEVAHIWGWDPISFQPTGVDDPDAQEIFADMIEQLAPNHRLDLAVAEHLDLDGHQLMLFRAALRRDTPDWPQLVELLGLQPEVAECVSRQRAVGDLPGAQTLEPQKIRTMFFNMVLEEADQSSFMGAWTRHSLNRAPLYIVSTLVLLALYALGITAALNGWISLWWLALFVPLVGLHAFEYWIYSAARKHRGS